MDACCMLVPSKIDVDGSNMRRQLCWVSPYHKRTCLPTPPRNHKTPKGHLNQSIQKVRSTKPKPMPLPTINNGELQRKTDRDIYIKMYKAKNTTYSDQTGRFPFYSQQR